MEQEESLARRARGGDRSAFEELVRRTSRLVYARLYLETGNPQEAEDLVQETYWRAFRSIRRLSDPAGFRRWLLTIAQTVAIDAFRRAGRRCRAAPARSSQAVLEGVAAPSEDEGAAERRETVRAVLQSLPEEYRLPLTLRYVAGADYDTITMQLGLSPGALRGLLYRGLQLLRRAVQSEVLHESR